MGHGTLLPYDKRTVGSFHSVLSCERRMKENRQNLSNWLQKLQLSCPPFLGCEEETCHACQIFLTVTVMAKDCKNGLHLVRVRRGNTGLAECERTSHYESEICPIGSYGIDIFEIHYTVKQLSKQLIVVAYGVDNNFILYNRRSFKLQ